MREETPWLMSRDDMHDVRDALYDLREGMTPSQKRTNTRISVNFLHAWYDVTAWKAGYTDVADLGLVKAVYSRALLDVSKALGR